MKLSKFCLAGGHHRRLFWKIPVLLLLLAGLWIGVKLARSPFSSLWAGTYFRELLAGRYHRASETTDMFFVMCDHWEPGRGQPAVDRSRDWLRRYGEAVAGHHDSAGRPFQYTWFYPIDNLEPPVLDLLSQAAGRGWGEIEVHWHHNHHSSRQYTLDMEAALKRFTAVGALISEPEGAPRWVFIHGNWALDGSSPDQCGINDEISILQAHGCYADMTFPAIEASGQPRFINRIYYAQDTPEPKSNDTGVEARVGAHPHGLLLLPGPLGMDFRNPLVLIEGAAIDNSEGTGIVGRVRPPKSYADYFKKSRIPLWDNIHISVAGKPEWCFVKVHAHGHQDTDILLDGELAAMLTEVEDYCRRRGIRLHYVTAREACNLVWAAEQGLAGDPGQYYDLVVPPPLNRKTAGADR